MTTRTETRDAVDSKQPWQLAMFRRALKKQQKLSALLKILGPIDAEQCLLLTCGDNNGALNWHFRQHGGRWTWADMEQSSVIQIAALTGDETLHISKETCRLPVPDNNFDVVVTIDVHEHLPQTQVMNQELARVTKAGGRVIVTTPGGDQRKTANRIKRWLGMRTSEYGHVVDGYSARALQEQLRAVQLQPYAQSSYSRFFTEMVELAINFAYVKLLAKRSTADVEQGQIAPQNQEQLQSVGKSYKIYAAAYPLFWLISQFDHLLFFRQGYAVIVAARKSQ
ncbi:MAG TPA: methyltransferase domain-containing protein [Candidatus Sulfomarinibacteraceae bacterium]|nr:methyltransferase domain-containing protein [Candidatus Sulfomarinibacteraceae bacterium]